MSKSGDDMLYRQTNLTFALLDSSRGRTREWIRRNVDGYQNVSEKTLQRDLRELRRVGVPVTITADEIHIAHDTYELPALELSPAEATAVGMAGELGTAGALGAFARSGWTKLAASGARRDLSSPQLASYTPYNDTTRLSPTFLATILSAVARRRRITFEYMPTPTAAVQIRTMDPWGLVPQAGRVYLVGHDLDRDAARSFRAVRVRGVNVLQDSAEHEAPSDLQEIVRGSLSLGRERVDAELRVEPGKGGEFGIDVDGKISLFDVDADWLIRTAAGYAPDVIVESPDDIRNRVIELLGESHE